MADGERRFVCQCFLTHNIFLKDYTAHVVFENEQQLMRDYKMASSIFLEQQLVAARSAFRRY